MYFYIMINYRKIRSKNKSRENYFKLLLKEVGTLTHKKYSSLIVNDIKIDFSIYLCKKTLNQNPKKIIKTPNKIGGKIYIMRDKSAEIRRNNLKKQNNIDYNYKNDFTYVKPIQKENNNKSFINGIYTKKMPVKIGISKTPLQTKFKKNVKKIKLINNINKIKIKNEYEENNKTEKENNKELINKKAEEIHESIIKDNNPLSQKNPPKRKFTLVHLESTFKTLKSQPIKDIKSSINKQQNDININNNNNNNNENNNILLSKIIEYNPEPVKEKIKKTKTIIEEIFLSPINYEQYISTKKNITNEETFCEGFFISSFPTKNGQVIEKSHSFPALCGHPECSSLPSMKSEIIYRYPLKDTKTLELNNLAATICFPTGIKVCYNEKGPGLVDDYVTRITNQKGERYYMITFHFYLEMDNYNYGEKYEMHPLKDYLRRFADDYLDMTESALNKEKEKIEKDLKQAQDFGLRDFVYIPFCICLISKYSYVDEIKKCLQSIFYIIKNNITKKNEINKLIMHLINSVPIPAIETAVQFYIPYNKTNQIILKYPKLNDLKIMNTAISNLLKYFSIDLILIIVRLLLFEKKILFIDDDYTLLSNVTDNFISLLYPFQWVHTYIPIMSDQMIQYLETFLPFINGISTTLLPLVKDLYEIGDMEQNEEIFLIYIKDNKLKLGTNLIGKNTKKKYKYKYVEENVPNFPINLEKELKSRLKKIKEEIERYEKKNQEKKNLEEFDLKIRVTFMEIFVQMFHDIDKYLVLLDEDIIFNKNYFLEKINKEDKKFYEEFCDTQLFQLFTQNYIKDDFNYFKIMMEDYNKNNGKFIYDEEKAKGQKIFNIKQMYIIPPEYLNIHEKNISAINDRINQKYKIIDEEDNNNKKNNERISEYIQEIDEKNYDNKNLNIYITPKELNKINNQNTTTKILNNILSNKKVPRFLSAVMKIRSKFKNRKKEMSEKEQEELKERIKDFTMKIFKSDISDLETVNNNNLTKEILNDINTNIGREFFVNLLSKNVNNYILLKNDFFILLGNIIFNTLLFMLQLQEDDKVLDEVVRLIKSLKNFAKEDEGAICIIIKGKKKCEVTLWDLYKTKIKSYSKVNQENLWFKWYKINLDNEKEDKNNPGVKKKVIIDLLETMADIELDYSFIKKTIGKLNKKIFENNEEKQNEITKAIQELFKKKK